MMIVVPSCLKDPDGARTRAGQKVNDYSGTIVSERPRWRTHTLGPMQKHNTPIHKGGSNTFGDGITSFSSMKVFQGICKSENLYNGKERILGFALKVFCKSPNKSVIKCIGSVTAVYKTSEKLQL